jgi:hypothetical protein
MWSFRIAQLLRAESGTQLHAPFQNWRRWCCAVTGRAVLQGRAASHVHNLKRRGHLKFFNHGKKMLRFRRSDVEAHIEKWTTMI